MKRILGPEVFVQIPLDGTAPRYQAAEPAFSVTHAGLHRADWGVVVARSARCRATGRQKLACGCLNPNRHTAYPNPPSPPGKRGRKGAEGNINKSPSPLADHHGDGPWGPQAVGRWRLAVGRWPLAVGNGQHPKCPTTPSFHQKNMRSGSLVARWLHGGECRFPSRRPRSRLALGP